MGPRLVILLVLAVILAILAGVKFSSPKPETVSNAPEATNTGDVEMIGVTNKRLDERPLAGEEPPVPPEFSIQVEVNKSTGKNRLEYWITEEHGYYVETFQIRFFHKENPDDTLADSSFFFDHFVNKFVPARESLHDCIEVVSAELVNVGGDIGETDNWGAEILTYGRARMENPDPLPLLSNVVDCSE